MAKTKTISKKRASKTPKVKTLDVPVDVDSLIAEFKGNFGRVDHMSYRKNPFRAETGDGLNVAYGKTKVEALQNLLKGVRNRQN